MGCKKKQEHCEDQNNDLVELQELNKDLQDKYLRAVAEVENTKHRAHLDVARKSQILLENFSKDLLPVLDNFERAMHAVNRDSENAELKNLLIGIDFIQNDLLKAIARHGIEKMGAIGDDFDPTKHQAIGFDAGEENKLVDIKQSGYLLNGRVIREAMVIVGKNE
ncbi:MAG: nucleotide exchange factor GrpE [Alphaproteobacteria bacterium]|nr:nucleotide exchange factor GrpE [Alphaproteobacteria bacterium]